MFNIAICDDEIYFRESIKKDIIDYMLRNGLVFHIDTYSSGEEFIALKIEMIYYNIVFLDIQMNEINGIMVAKKIREISDNVFVVFVSAYLDYTVEGYKVDAIRYLLKDRFNFKNSMDECMDAIINKMKYKAVKKEFKFTSGVKAIYLERILYIESRLHKLVFHIIDHTSMAYTMYKTLDQMEEELKDSNFIRIHQSFLVNLKHIKNIFHYKAVLSNGVELTIPKARYKQVSDIYVAYQGEV